MMQKPNLSPASDDAQLEMMKVKLAVLAQLACLVLSESSQSITRLQGTAT